MSKTAKDAIFVGGLAKKLIVAILLFSSIITLLGTSLQLYIDYSRDVGTIETAFDQIKKTHKETIENNLWVLDMEDLEVHLRGILTLPGMEYLEITKDDAKIISVGRLSGQRVITRTYPLKYSFRGKEINLGLLKASANLQVAYDRFFDNVFLILTTQAIKTFLVSFFILFLFYLLVGRHLKKLAGYAQKLTIDNLNTPISLDRRKKQKCPPDELDIVVGAINDMRGNLNEDIKARLKAETALKEHEHLLNEIIEGTSDAIFLKDLDLRYLLVNKAAAAAVGKSKEEIIGKADEELFPRHSSATINKSDSYVLQSGRPLLSEERLETVFGESIWLANKSPLLDEKGKVTGLIGISRNITEIKRTKEELNHELLINKALAEMASAIITSGHNIKTIAGKVCDYARQISGSAHCCVSEIDRKTGAGVCHVSSAILSETCKEAGSKAPPVPGTPEQYPNQSNRLRIPQEPFFTNSPRNHPFTSDPSTGLDSVSNLLAVPVTYADDMVGEIILADSPTGYTEDLLNAVQRLANLYAIAIYRHRLEEDSNRMEEKLRQSQKLEAVGTLAGGIAHDFNNILGVILGYAEMAQEDAPAGSRYAGELGRIITAGNRAKDLVKQILAFSRQSKVERIPIQPQLLVRETIKMLRASIPATIQIRENIAPDCSTVLADPAHIQQIVMNLCTNANHAMEKKGGILEIGLQNTFIDQDNPRYTPNMGKGHYVELTVTDSGAGIGPDIIDKIFDPYFTTKEVGKGTGMGLAIVHGIISDYGGSITVESRLGEGTAFHVYFPAYEHDELPVEMEPKDTPLPKGSGRILFVDDEEILTEMVKDILERLGYTVTTHCSSIDALTAFKNTPDAFDAVITDQTMPDMTGSELARELLRIRPDIPIILCTGYSNLIDKKTAKSIGIREFAYKPLTKEEIASLLKKILDNPERED